MVKSIKSVYFESRVLIAAEDANLDSKAIDNICNEAVRMASDKNSEVGAKLNQQAELSKDNQTMVRYYSKFKTVQGRKVWVKAVAMYAQKYEMTEEDVIRRFRD